MFNRFLRIFLLLCLPWLATAEVQVLQAINTESPKKVLVFTKTEGHRHGSISEGVALIRRLGKRNGFLVDHTARAERFNTKNLKKYALVIFLSTTGELLDDLQQEAFESYIKAGGNFMGIHAAADAEYSWDWYGKLIGGYFESHPEPQNASVVVNDHTHPATKMLPATWSRFDEWYNFKNLKEDLQILLTLDESTYSGGAHGEVHPIAWCHEFEGGRSFYTGFGHGDAAFREPLVEQHILGGIQWCLRSDE